MKSKSGPAGELRLVGVVSTALRREPSHAAEQISRLVYGEPFSVSEWSRDGDWCLGAGPDQYQGWLRAWHLGSPMEKAPRSDRVVVGRSSLALCSPDLAAPVKTDLSFGTRLCCLGDSEAGYCPVRGVCGEVLWVPAGDLELWPGPADGQIDRVLARGRSLLGVPYEWGGRSSAGFDCSGLTQVLLGSVGKQLPRDAALQAELGGGLPGAVPFKAGALVFYGEQSVTHVGIVAREGLLLHARGEVRLEACEAGFSLQSGDRQLAPVKIFHPWSE